MPVYADHKVSQLSLPDVRRLAELLWQRYEELKAKGSTLFASGALTRYERVADILKQKEDIL